MQLRIDVDGKSRVHLVNHERQATILRVQCRAARYRLPEPVGLSPLPMLPVGREAHI